jgi:hypothetical protein
MLWFHCSIIDVMCFKDGYPRSSCYAGANPAYAHLHLSLLRPISVIRSLRLSLVGISLLQNFVAHSPTMVHTIYLSRRHLIRNPPPNELRAKSMRAASIGPSRLFPRMPGASSCKCPLPPLPVSGSTSISLEGWISHLTGARKLLSVIIEATLSPSKLKEKLSKWPEVGLGKWWRAAGEVVVAMKDQGNGQRRIASMDSILEFRYASLAGESVLDIRTIVSRYQLTSMDGYNFIEMPQIRPVGI